jgi:hypothetical protein
VIVKQVLCHLTQAISPSFAFSINRSRADGVGYVLEHQPSKLKNGS